MTKHITYKLDNRIIIILYNKTTLKKRMTHFKLIKHNIINNIFNDNLIYYNWPIHKVVKLSGKRLYGLKGFPTIHRYNTANNTLYIKINIYIYILIKCID